MAAALSFAAHGCKDANAPHAPATQPSTATREPAGTTPGAPNTPAPAPEAETPAARSAKDEAQSGAGQASQHPQVSGSHAGPATPPHTQRDGASGSAPAGPTLQEAMQQYKTWTKRQAEPRAISAEIFALCRAPSAAETAFVDSVHGKSLALLDWLNEPAVRGFTAGGKPAFPVGAAIVKQKLVGTGADARVAALGLMVKRQAGFDPAHGDWEFGYWEEAPGLASGAAVANACGGCHASSASDFVFVDQGWRAPR